MASSATASLLPRIPACKSTIRCLSLPHLPQPRVSTSSFSVDSTNFSESSRRFSSLQIIKASSTDETSIDAGELLTDLKEKVRIKSWYWYQPYTLQLPNTSNFVTQSDSNFSSLWYTIVGCC
ncbi:hypothetical protein Dimus_005207 [Dionaea muscipula]